MSSRCTTASKFEGLERFKTCFVRCDAGFSAVDFGDDPISLPPDALQQQGVEGRGIDFPSPLKTAGLPIGFGNSSFAQMLFRQGRQIGRLEVDALAFIGGLTHGMEGSEKLSSPNP